MVEYQTIAAPSTASFLERKSEFIAYLAPVTTQDEAIKVIESERHRHRKAKHSVYAYLLREGNASRYSDDGEPQGTAGTPVLDVLQKSGLTDVCCVVTRYFGGVLLGSNGLIRAYSRSASLAVEQAKIKIMRPCYPVTIRTDYTQYGKITYHMPQTNVIPVETLFEDKVTVRLLVQEDVLQAVKKEMIDLTGNRLSIQVGELQYADFSKCKGTIQ